MRDLIGRREDTHVMVIGVVVAAAFLVTVALGLDRLHFDVLSGVMTVLILTLLFVPLLMWVARKEGDPWLGNMLLWALLAKFVFTLVRYFVITQVYGDNGDAGVYAGGGEYLADLYTQGIFTTDIPFLDARGPETTRISVIVGAIYTITGFSRYAASFVFASFCFWGQVLMFRAFKRAVPDGDHRRYAILVLFLPSLLFWPSSIGKEAVMVGCIGVASYGAAHILSERVHFRGLVIFGAGVGGLFLFRPHMALIAIVSLGLASAVGTLAGFGRRASNRAFAVRFGALLLLVIAGAFATTQVSRFLADSSTEETGVSAVLERTLGQTAQGGSEFNPSTIGSPVDLPAATVTVLFRPFPWEARNLNGLIASAEGLLLIGLFVTSGRRFLTWMRTAPRRPYLIYAAAFALVFIVAFSYVGNFGILARQRTQMLPLVLTLIAMYPAAGKRVSWFGGRPDRSSGETTPTSEPAVALGESR